MGALCDPLASPSISSWEPLSCFAFSGLRSGRVASGYLGGRLCDFSWRNWSANPFTATLPLVCQHGGSGGQIFQAVFPRLGFSLVAQTWCSSSGRSMDKSLSFFLVFQGVLQDHSSSHGYLTLFQSGVFPWKLLNNPGWLLLLFCHLCFRCCPPFWSVQLGYAYSTAETLDLLHGYCKLPLTRKWEESY